MSEMRAYRYQPPDLAGRPRVTVDICNTDMMNTFVTVTTVGENKAHSHFAEDATWLVIAGTVAFYDEEAGTKIVLEKNDFICVPAGTRYWFESEGDEVLELCRFACRDLAQTGPFDPNRPRGNPNQKAEEINTAVSV